MAHKDPTDSILALENEFIDNDRGPDVEDPNAEDEIRRGEQHADDDRDLVDQALDLESFVFGSPPHANTSASL